MADDGGGDEAADGKAKREPSGCGGSLDGCSAVFDGGCCLLEAVTVFLLVLVPALLLR